jgi:uncharacterized protein (DUF952 family)
VTVTEPPTDRSNRDEPILHLALPDDWAAAFAGGRYTTSTRGVTLEQQGFIHCSTHDQLEGTANRFYADLDQLVVLTIDPLLVPSPIVFEPGADLDVLFPHIYGPLPVAAVNRATPWLRVPGTAWSTSTL